MDGLASENSVILRVCSLFLASVRHAITQQLQQLGSTYNPILDTST